MDALALAIAFGRDYRFPRLPITNGNAFYGMPVGDIAPASASLRPDIAPFILNDAVVMDAGFFERLTETPPPVYVDIAEFYRTANEHGHLRLVDFEVVLQEERHRLDEMMQIDVEDIEPWIPRIIESLEIWDSLLSKSSELKASLESDDVVEFNPDRGHLYHCNLRHALSLFTHSIRSRVHYLSDIVVKADDYANVDLYKALLFKSHRRTKLQRAVLKSYVETRLAYVNANIVLAHKYKAALYDWNDFAPFYRRKFAQVGQTPPQNTESQGQLSKLFSLLFPNQAITDYAAFFKTLEDRRVEELRALCNDAARGKAEFDEEFASSVWREQLKWIGGQRRFSRRISWWTLPANAVPYLGTALSFGTQKVAEATYSRTNPEPFPWLFVFSDIFELDGEREG